MSEEIKKPTPLQEAMQLVTETVQPCDAQSANGFKSTTEFVQMVENHIGPLSLQEMKTELERLGFKSTYVEGIGITWYVLIL